MTNNENGISSTVKTISEAIQIGTIDNTNIFISSIKLFALNILQPTTAQPNTDISHINSVSGRPLGYIIPNQ